MNWKRSHDALARKVARRQARKRGETPQRGDGDPAGGDEESDESGAEGEEKEEKKKGEGAEEKEGEEGEGGDAKAKEEAGPDKPKRKKSVKPDGSWRPTEKWKTSRSRSSHRLLPTASLVGRTRSARPPVASW